MSPLRGKTTAPAQLLELHPDVWRLDGRGVSYPGCAMRYVLEGKTQEITGLGLRAVFIASEDFAEYAAKVEEILGLRKKARDRKLFNETGERVSRITTGHQRRISP